MGFGMRHIYYGFLFKIWRRKRFELFVKLIRPRPTDRLLDVGGEPHNWLQFPPVVGKIDLLNLKAPNWNPTTAPAYAIDALVGDGCKMTFTDASYDIAFSNSVLEHVGSWEKQQAFAAEIRRVGKSLWVQTPAYESPIETHFLGLGLHWLPMRMRKLAVRWLSLWGWMERRNKTETDEFVESIRLLTKKEMHQLFPDCEVRTEKYFGLIPKSHIAVRKIVSSEQ